MEEEGESIIMESPEFKLADEKRRANQLEINQKFLLDAIMGIHANLCPKGYGTWQMKVGQAVEASKKMKEFVEGFEAIIDRNDKNLEEIKKTPCGSVARMKKQSDKGYLKNRPKYKTLNWKSICQSCATEEGTVWPDGHVATFWMGVCDGCNKERSLCDVTDYNWPPKAKVDLSAGREF